MRTTTARRLAALAVVGGLALLGSAGTAQAHPLGNFTTNTADRVQVVAGGVEVLHVIDLAEVPTLQLAQPSRGVDTSGDGALDADELAAHAAQECARVAPQLRLVVDGAPALLTLDEARGEPRPGQAGLATARLECSLSAPERPTTSLSYEDLAGAQRNGWAEVTLSSTCGRLSGSTAPEDSTSGLLTAYPEDQLSSPLAVRTADAQVTAGGECTSGRDADEAVAAAQPRGTDRLTGAFTDFVTRPDLSVAFVVGAVLLSVAFGAAHAVAPGHGKTVVAAYLVGQRGTRRQAVWLGSAVTVAHTGSVLALGAVLSLSTLASPERVVPYSEVVSGVLLALVGGYLLLGARHRRAHEHARHVPHEHDHEHDHPHPQDHPHPHDHEHPRPHDHEHPHPHDHEHEPVGGGATALASEVRLRPAPTHQHTHGGRTHSHAPLDDRPLGWRSLAAMGLAGGLVPSPSALVVLLGATALGRAWFGVLLVLCYGLGMAITLTAAGLLLLRTQALLVRRGWALGAGSRAARWLPVVTATLVVLVGLVLVGRGLLASYDLR